MMVETRTLCDKLSVTVHWNRGSWWHRERISVILMPSLRCVSGAVVILSTTLDNYLLYMFQKSCRLLWLMLAPICCRRLCTSSVLFINSSWHGDGKQCYTILCWPNIKEPTAFSRTEFLKYFQKAPITGNAWMWSTYGISPMCAHLGTSSLAYNYKHCSGRVIREGVKTSLKTVIFIWSFWWSTSNSIKEAHTFM